MATTINTPFSPCHPVDRPRPSSCCMTTDTPIKRPDPATYSQNEQFALGAQPTWNSPDILTNVIGASHLNPETTVVIRNNSPTVSAVGVNVHCFVSRFGIGFERTLIGIAGVNLAPSEEKALLIPLPQAVLNGDQRVGFHVRIEHSADARLINNSGSQIIEAFSTSAQGRSIDASFLVRNPLSTPQAIMVQKLATQPGILSSFAIAGGTFGPFEERICLVHIEVEGWLTGTHTTFHDREITFVARGADGRVIDGLTYFLRVNT